MPIIQLYGRCPSCGQIVELMVDIDKRTVTGGAEGSYIVPCCYKCKEHSPLYILLPFEIRSSRFMDAIRWEKVDE